MKKILGGLLCVAALFGPVAAAAQAVPTDFTVGARFDAARRITGMISPDPDGVGGVLTRLAVRNTYDDAGRLVKVEKGDLAAWQAESIEPKNWTGFTVHQTIESVYDVVDRKIVEQVRGGSAGSVFCLTQFSYAATGRLECTAIRMNPAAFGSLPAGACSLGTSGSQGSERITRNVYDANGQISRTCYGYDLDLRGNRIWQTSPRSNIASCQ